jgi:hypothetical protein
MNNSLLLFHSKSDFDILFLFFTTLIFFLKYDRELIFFPSIDISIALILSWNSLEPNCRRENRISQMEKFVLDDNEKCSCSHNLSDLYSCFLMVGSGRLAFPPTRGLFNVENFSIFFLSFCWPFDNEKERHSLENVKWRNE